MKKKNKAAEDGEARGGNDPGLNWVWVFDQPQMGELVEGKAPSLPTGIETVNVARSNSLELNQIGSILPFRIKTQLNGNYWEKGSPRADGVNENGQANQGKDTSRR